MAVCLACSRHLAASEWLLLSRSSSRQLLSRNSIKHEYPQRSQRAHYGTRKKRDPLPSDEADRQAARTLLYLAQRSRSRVIVARNPDETSQKDILGHVTPCPVEESNYRDNASVVLLVTRKFAPWLEGNDSTFLSSFLRRLFPAEAPHLVRNTLSSYVNVLTAVVDRVPTPSPSGVIVDQPWEETVPQTQAIPLSSDDFGYEGIAYIASAAKNLIPQLDFESVQYRPNFGTSEEVVRRKVLTPTPEVNYLTFSFGTERDVRDEEISNTASEETGLHVDVPLANTVFINGRPSMLQLSKWFITTRLERCIWKGPSDMKHFRVGLTSPPISCMGVDLNKPLKYNVYRGMRMPTPLVQLTSAYEIKTIMGNVIRELDKPDTSGDLTTVPASRELEDLVPRFIAEHQAALNDSHALPVWALVIPRHLLKHRDLKIRETLQSHAPSTSNPFPTLPDLPKLIWHGAHLHKILGGGGGWGNKAGLLSLDPETSYEPPLQPPESERDDMPIFPLFATSGGSNIAEPGDLITFLTAKPTSSEPLPGKDLVMDVYTRRFSFSFGMLSASADEAPDTSTETDQPRLQSFANHFGVLAETGLALQRVDPETKRFHSTKLDVPSTRLLYQVTRLAPDILAPSRKKDEESS